MANPSSDETRLPAAVGIFGNGEGDRYQILLRVSEAANAHLEFNKVLEAVAEVLRPIVEFDVLAVARVENGGFRGLGVYVVGVPVRIGESPLDTLRRGLDSEVPTLDEWPVEGTAVGRAMTTGRSIVSGRLDESCHFLEDETLLALGIRSYLVTPLFVRDQMIGSLSFLRRRPFPLPADEVSFLEGVSRPIATAVSNALAYEQIRLLKDRLAAENLALKEEIDRQAMFEEIIGSSVALRRMLSMVSKVASTDTTVLITGETGTGKELVARAIHKQSPRRSRSLIKVNCGALPASLIASELFGHEKGAFTGAVQQRIGRFELASGGSIFLDEVGELPPDVQVTLLRVLQEGDFERVGGSRTMRSDARVIAATNRNLEAAVEEGCVRSDLYYRLNVFPIEVPPLRERREDVPLLVRYFACRYASRLRRERPEIEPETMRRLTRYEWPGNVRELQNVIERAVVLAEGRLLRVEEAELGKCPRTSPVPGGKEGRREFEASRIERALGESGGRVAGRNGAAARLGVPNTTLESRIKRYGIDKYRFQR